LSTNRSTINGEDANEVTFAEGTLFYNPGSIRSPGPSFSNESQFPLRQFYSDRKYGGPIATLPFDPSKTDNLDITIEFLIKTVPQRYLVSIGPAGSGTRQSFTPQCGGGVIYGFTNQEQIMTISLCDKTSEITPQ
jgi:hypothetical protein